MKTAKDYAESGQFAQWVDSEVIDVSDPNFKENMMDSLKYGASMRGYNPESIWNFKVEEHPSFPNSVIVSARFNKEKE